MKTVRTLLAAASLLLAVILGFIWSGIYNIAANEPQARFTLWLLAKARDRSIAFHSDEIQLEPMSDPKLVAAAFNDYKAMCRLCHAVSRYPSAEFARGLYPKPPNLAAQSVQSRSNSELYWIIQNGIKRTGMPSFGLTLSRDEILSLLAHLRRVGDVEEGGYTAMLKTTGAGRDEEQHLPTAPNDRNDQRTPPGFRN